MSNLDLLKKWIRDEIRRLLILSKTAPYKQQFSMNDIHDAKIIALNSVSDKIKELQL